ncbi:MAG: DUF2191 domain-containing protein [Burkholderiales bacterium 66-5]|nr:MAG: DUF2191 domain-containing protein [Burkholderiales bacterium 66-5]
MRTTMTIDDALYEQALALADPDMDKAELLREAVKTFVRVQSARRLAALGGAMPDMAEIPRRQPTPEDSLEQASLT